MTKKELAIIIAQEAGISNAAGQRAIDAMTVAITKALNRGDDVRLPGFGTFSSIRTKARDGRNPKTGETIKIQAGNRPAFKAGSNLKAALNS